MQITEITPAEASVTDLEQWREVLNAMTAEDMPDEPRWVDDRLREYLSITLPGERRLAFVARDGDQIVGHANLLLFGGEFDHTGVFEIFVRPGQRGSGIGRRLLRALAERASEEGRHTIGVEVIATTPAVGFYDRLGFERAVVENRNVLKMNKVDWPWVEDMAGRIAAGYRLEYYTGELPDHLMERYAATKVHLKAEPAYNVGSWRGSADALRLRNSLETLAARGLRTHIVVAISEAMEMVVGLTELVVAAQRPTRGDQYDTVVAPQHRSYGLGMAMKARMLCELREAEAQLRDVQTWTALEGDPMSHIDSALGFRNDVQWYEYETEVAALLDRLGD